jgi:hypothetical protein
MQNEAPGRYLHTIPFIRNFVATFAGSGTRAPTRKNDKVTQDMDTSNVSS